MTYVGYAPWAPEHVRYEQVPFKRLMRPVERPLHGHEEIVTAYRDGTVTARSKRRATGYTEAADLSSYKRVEVGDLVVHGLDILAGAVGVSDSEGAMSAVCTTCVATAAADPRFVAYAIRTQARTGFTAARARGIRQRSADFRRWETLADLPVPAPPLEEQRRIADYLDAEVSQVARSADAIARAIDLLDERDDSVIYQTISACPAIVTPIRYLARYVNGYPFKPEDQGEEGRPIVRIAQLLNPDADMDRYDGDPDPYCHIDTGDLVFSWSATLAARFWNRGPAYLNQHLFKVLPAADIDARWLRYALQTAIRDLTPYMQGSTMSHITKPMMSAVGVPTPGLAEQIELANELDRTLADSQEMRAASRRQLRLLEERKQALITAAVTGEITV